MSNKIIHIGNDNNFYYYYFEKNENLHYEIIVVSPRITKILMDDHVFNELIVAFGSTDLILSSSYNYIEYRGDPEPIIQFLKKIAI